VSLILKINLFVLTLLKFCKKKKLNKKFIFCKKYIYIVWISNQKKKTITTKLIFIFKKIKKI